jgi:signal recognition particle subunit SRP68
VLDVLIDCHAAVLKIIHTSRQTYGLRTNDYSRYHAHAVKRVSTLHRATKTVNKPSTKNKNAVSSTSSKKLRKIGASTATKNNKDDKLIATRKQFISTTSQINVDSALKDERILELLLWEAERAWSEGMRQREELAILERNNTKSSIPLAAKRHSYIKRFQRASQHAEALSNIAKQFFKMPSQPLTASAAFQIEICHQYMNGTLAFAKASSSSSSAASSSTSTSLVQPLAAAYVLLENYGKTSNRATEEAIAFELLDELEPMIRFCAYKAGISTDKETAETARDIGKDTLQQLQQAQAFPSLIARYTEEEKVSSKKRSKDIQTVHQLTWRDIDIPIRSAELAEALGSVVAALQSIKSRRTRKAGKSVSAITADLSRFKTVPISVYERALSSLIEAEERSRKLVDDNNTALAKAHSARFEASAKPLGTAHSYIAFNLISVRLQRDEALLESTLTKLKRRENKAISTSISFGPIATRVKRRRMKLYPILIKLLDGMVQSLENLRELSVVEEDTRDMGEQVDSLIAYTKARR